MAGRGTWRQRDLASLPRTQGALEFARQRLVAAVSEDEGITDPALVKPRRLLHFRERVRLLEERAGASPVVHLLRAELGALRDDLRTQRGGPGRGLTGVR